MVNTRTLQKAKDRRQPQNLATFAKCYSGKKKILINILYIFSNQLATFSSYAENLLNLHVVAAAYKHAIFHPANEELSFRVLKLLKN